MAQLSEIYESFSGIARWAFCSFPLYCIIYSFILCLSSFFFLLAEYRGTKGTSGPTRSTKPSELEQYGSSHSGQYLPPVFLETRIAPVLWQKATCLKAIRDSSFLLPSPRKNTLPQHQFHFRVTYKFKIKFKTEF